MDIIRKNKPKLIEWLRLDPFWILQHMQSAGIITDREYSNLKSISVPDDMATNILDTILAKYDRTCVKFLAMIQDNKVNEPYPELRQWISTISLSGLDMEFLQSNKAALCTLLTEHFEKVMDLVEEMITMKEYKLCEKGGEKWFESLLAIMIDKGEDACQKFATILRENYPEVKKLSNSEETGPQLYADQGSAIVASETTNTTMNTYKMEIHVDGHQGGSQGPSLACPQPLGPSSGSRMVATNNSYIFAPKLTGSKVEKDVSFSFNFNSGSKNAGTHSQISGTNTGKRPHTTISDKLDFFKEHHSDLTQKVKNVPSLLDALIQKDFHKEMVANVRAEKTPQMQMRKILEATTTKAIAEVLFQALLTHEGELMNELMKS